MTLRLFAIISLLFLLFAGCTRNSNYEHLVEQASDNTYIFSSSDEQRVNENPSHEPLTEMYILWDNGFVQYGSMVEGNNLVLYAMENSNITQLAVFYPIMFEWGTEWAQGATDLHVPPGIIRFEVTDDWIILSVGEIQGSMGNFFGGIFRIKRDGGGRETLPFHGASSDFLIINDWIYYHDWCLQGCYGEGWIRIPIDGIDIEPLDQRIRHIYFYSECGYIYGAHRTDEMINSRNPAVNLVRWQPGSDEVITLFEGDVLPICDYASSIGFSDIVIRDGHITFTAFVWGYWGGGWRGSLLYAAEYRVDRDGGNLVFLNEEFHCPCIQCIDDVEDDYVLPEERSYSTGWAAPFDEGYILLEVGFNAEGQPVSIAFDARGVVLTDYFSYEEVKAFAYKIMDYPEIDGSDLITHFDELFGSGGHDVGILHIAFMRAGESRTDISTITHPYFIFFR